MQLGALNKKKRRRNVAEFEPLAERVVLLHEQVDTRRESSTEQIARRYMAFLAFRLLGKWVRRSVAPGLL